MKKGITFSLLVLMETVLAVVVVVTLGLTVNNFIGNASFFQSFFAKDNAHIIETLHAVPNGDVHIGYLWTTPDFEITMRDQEVSVSKVEKKAGVRSTIDEKIKAFGKSKSLPVGDPNNNPLYKFEPRYYQYILSSAEHKISIAQQFNSITCPGTPGAFSQVRVTTQTNQLSDADMVLFARSIENAVRVEGAAKPQTGKTPSMHLVLIVGLPQATAVYYSRNDDNTVRLACTLARTVSDEYQNARYGHISQAPSDVQSNTQDVTVFIRASEENIRAYQQKIIDGLLASQKGDS